KGVLPKEYARPALNAVMLGELIDLISNIALGEARDTARDVLGRVYEYFLGQFAGSEGKRGGEFYTPRSVVRGIDSDIRWNSEGLFHKNELPDLRADLNSGESAV
ncbi:MAG: N-6 DNA methylase, partial [Thermostichus sp. BF3_bins_97]